MSEHDRHQDEPVPAEEQVACTLWKCHLYATQGMGDGSVTWWTIQPIERQWWKTTAERFLESHVADDLRREALEKASDRLESFFGTTDTAHILAQKFLRAIASDYPKEADCG